MRIILGRVDSNGGLVPEGQAKVARRFIAGLSDQRAPRPGGTIEKDTIRFADHASRRDAGALWNEPGNELPGYSQKSLWDFNASFPISIGGL